MPPHVASLINAVTLLVMSGWGYLSGGSPTALIPAGFAIALLACLPGVKSANKVIAHIAVVLTLLLVFALFKPLIGAIGRGDALAILRVGLMLGSSVLAVVFFVKSFIDVRRQRTVAQDG